MPVNFNANPSHRAAADTSSAHRTSVWHGAQFGVSLAVACNIFLWLSFIGWTLFQNRTFGAEQWALSLWLGAILTCSSFAPGWIAFGVSVRRSQSIGWGLATGLALLCGLLGALVFLMLRLLWEQLPFEWQPRFAYPRARVLNQPIWLHLVVLALALTLIARLVFPLFCIGGHRLLRSPLSGMAAGALLLIQPALAFKEPVQLAALHWASVPVSQSIIARDEDIDLLIRQKGLAADSDLALLVQYPKRPAPLFGPSTIAKAQLQLNLPASGLRDGALRTALLRTPDKINWILDASGQGDADSMAEVLALSWGAIRVNVRPGVYTPEPGAPSAASPIDTLNLPDQSGDPRRSAPRGPIARALWEQAHMYRTASPGSDQGAAARRFISLEPDPDGGVLFVEVQPLFAPSSFVLEHATIKFELARGVSWLSNSKIDAALTLEPGARLKDVRILAPGPKDTVFVGSDLTKTEPVASRDAVLSIQNLASLFAAIKITPDPQAQAAGEAVRTPLLNPSSSTSTPVATPSARAPIAILDGIDIRNDSGELLVGIAIEGPSRIQNSRIGPVTQSCVEIAQNAPAEFYDNDFSECPGAEVPMVGTKLSTRRGGDTPRQEDPALFAQEGRARISAQN